MAAAIASPSRIASAFDRLRARRLVALFLASTIALLTAASIVTPRGIQHVDERVLSILVMLGFVFALLVSARRAGIDWRRLFGASPGRDVLPLLLVVVPVILLTFASIFAVFVPLSYRWPRFVERHLLAPRAFFEVSTIPEWLALVVAACVVAPIVEETIFRGILMQRWARRWGTPTGVLASSLAFALLHDEWLGKIVFGVAMCALYLRTRRLWVPIAAHAINNALFILPSLAGAIAHEKEKPQTLAEFRAQWWMGAAALVAGVVLLRIYLQRFWPHGLLRATLRGPTPYDRAADSPPAAEFAAGRAG